jgi:cytochrome c-type biogenesis protein
LMSAGQGLRTAMGALLVAVGIAVITGADKQIEAWLVEHSPQWLTWLTTSV